jgi:hypothetical protein
VQKKDITEKQLEKIKNHIHHGKKVGILYCIDENRWVLNETEDHISGFTIIDNFNIEEFLNKIGVQEYEIGEDTDYWTGTDDQIP